MNNHLSDHHDIKQQDFSYIIELKEHRARIIAQDKNQKPI